MNMPQIRKTVRDIGSMELCSSMDLGMKLQRKNDPCHPIKSGGVHAYCRVPLVKLAIILLVSVTALCTFFAIRCACRNCGCRDD
ncbi:MAG: hypothetical protein IJC50_04995 [Clostridia bacterium]|nr:hypothetical protein [Clostridia bacterium]